jgi:hypothetical protein
VVSVGHLGCCRYVLTARGSGNAKRIEPQGAQGDAKGEEVNCPSFLDKRPLKQGCNSYNCAGLFLEMTVILSRCRNDGSPVVMSSRASRYV